MKAKDFIKIVKQNPNLKEVEISRNGEILLNPELVEILKYSYEHNIKITVNTGVNLNYLTEEQAEALVKYQVASIIVSLDGATSETYKIYRHYGDFNKVLENIQKINKYKKLYNGSYRITI